MKKFITAFDSFKGTMSAVDACEQASGGIRAVFPQAQVVTVPIADGGEGTADAFRHCLPGEEILEIVTSAVFAPIHARYTVMKDGKAIIEVASAAGLPQAVASGIPLNPMNTTTYGVGELIRGSLKHGCRELILGLGGSATNDGGVGILSALGARFFDGSGKKIRPTGGGLEKLARIDLSGLDPRLKECKITLACDVDNPLCGPEGASAVFGPQKGATPEQVKALDENLLRFAGLIEAAGGRDVLSLKGGGAAGGIAAGLFGFLDVELKSGIDLLFETIGFETLLRGADLVFTGEGKMDLQSARGKAPAGVGKWAKAAGVPVVAVVGDVGDGYEAILDFGVKAVFSINHLAKPYPEIKARAYQDLKDTVENICRLLAAEGF
ncbi:MAG: glycerate kinase [Oscillospiraceae bacterium]|jgi:glycerate kinase|nr:glycerate kinase [Oscillospiraceae bacterium]